jgi:hypothetical protein
VDRRSRVADRLGGRHWPRASSERLERIAQRKARGGNDLDAGYTATAARHPRGWAVADSGPAPQRNCVYVCLTVLSPLRQVTRESYDWLDLLKRYSLHR